MQTLLMVFDARLGDERAIRDIHRDFPADALADGAGVEQVVAFIGSGRYVLELTVSDGDVQRNLHAFLGHPRVQEMFGLLRAHVPALPVAGTQTADMPISTAMLLWRSDRVQDGVAL